MIIDAYRFGGGGGGVPGPMPTYFATGPQVSTTSPTLSVPWPAGHAMGDLGICCVLAIGGTPSTPSGWSLMYVVGQTFVYSRIAASGAEGVAAVGMGTATYLAGATFVFRGVDPAGFVDASSDSTGTPSATIPLPSLVTTAANRMIVYIVSDNYDGSQTRFSAWTNANLSSLSERADFGTGTGTGGGCGVASGGKAAAGDIGAGSVAFGWTATSYTARAIALKPPNV